MLFEFGYNCHAKLALTNKALDNIDKYIGVGIYNV